MLVLRRRTGESFIIGDNIRITVVATKEKEVRIAIDAPKDMVVLRGELVSAMNENRDAANEQSLPQDLLAAFSVLTQEDLQNNT